MQEKTLEEEFEEAWDEGSFTKHGSAKRFVYELISSREEKAREEGRKEERQFILNVLDGIDIADKQMGVVGGTKAIRISLQNRII